MDATAQYRYHDAGPTYANAYLWPVVRQQIARRFEKRPPGFRAFDLGCGSGATANMLADLGFDVVGVDMSSTGIDLARTAYPNCRFEIGSAYDDLAAKYGRFPLVVSLEVVEHLYDPRKLANRLFDLVEPGGLAIISTPYHGYWKNLALALTGKLDAHFTVLWDGGHIKFFSIDSLRKLLTEARFEQMEFIRVGRIALLAKSMIAIAQKPR